MRICITGSAGFIGSHVSRHLASQGHEVIGFDNFNDYYDPELKRKRLEELVGTENFKCIKGDLSSVKDVESLFSNGPFDRVIHLAAQAGVRYSIDNPHTYIESNIVGFLNILEACRHNEIKHLIFASSSSVYGANETHPYSTHHSTDHPVSLYGATKKSNELMAHSYSSLYGLPVTGLRFFTVYGPWGRPDMAYYNFTKKIMKDEVIDVYNGGHHQRDFTYIDDIVESIVRLLDIIPEPDSNWNSKSPDLSSSSAPYRLYNIGNSSPIELLKFIEILESIIGREAKKNFIDKQLGDVLSTAADTKPLSYLTGFAPNTSLEVGLEKFVRWYREYHGNQ